MIFGYMDKWENITKLNPSINIGRNILVKTSFKIGFETGLGRHCKIINCG
jgi:hypothetical protein